STPAAVSSSPTTAPAAAGDRGGEQQRQLDEHEQRIDQLEATTTTTVAPVTTTTTPPALVCEISEPVAAGGGDRSVTISTNRPDTMLRLDIEAERRLDGRLLGYTDKRATGPDGKLVYWAGREDTAFSMRVFPENGADSPTCEIQIG
ncbi:MAG: hypothetical protein ACREQL_12600, partial [Candidatus Binatia bacterium]